jgi:hypothetical protein
VHYDPSYHIVQSTQRTHQKNTAVFYVEGASTFGGGGAFQNMNLGMLPGGGICPSAARFNA